MIQQTVQMLVKSYIQMLIALGALTNMETAGVKNKIVGFLMKLIAKTIL
jgi:hypothetical protein